MSILRRTGYRLSKTALRSPLIWLRHRGLDPADVMIASYPRSGNTWCRFLLAEILTDGTAGFDSIDKTVPQVGLHQVALSLLPGGGRLIKTHEKYRKEYAQAIYLVRDVRDVVLSYYDRGKYLGLFNDIAFDAFLPMFLQGQMNTVGSWSSHVRAWLNSPVAQSGMLIVRFEDMRQNTEATLVTMLDFLGVPADKFKIRNAITANSVDRMRAKEDRSRAFPQSCEESGRFVRKGAVGSWQERFTAEQIALVERYAGAELERLGYSEKRLQ
jgi:estrone sulfotransferase